MWVHFFSLYFSENIQKTIAVLHLVASLCMYDLDTKPQFFEFYNPSMNTFFNHKNPEPGVSVAELNLFSLAKAESIRGRLEWSDRTVVFLSVSRTKMPGPGWHMASTHFAEDNPPQLVRPLIQQRASLDVFSSRGQIAFLDVMLMPS